MSGITSAICAGIGFGIFQAVNRLALRGADPYRVTFGLLLVGSVGLSAWTAFTQDLDILFSAPAISIASFAAAGVLHFFFGWTFLSLSQQRIGATETSAVVAVNPLIGTLLAAAVLDESVTWVALVGVLVVSSGVVVLSLRRANLSTARQVPWFGLATALCWGSSPLFIRWGLVGVPAPVVGVTVGLVSATLVYAIAIVLTGRRNTARIPTSSRRWVVLAGLLVAASIALQWIAFDLIAIAVAITLMQLAVPTVLVVAPLVLRTPIERLTPRLVLGAAAVVGGSVLVVLAGAA